MNFNSGGPSLGFLMAKVPANMLNCDVHVWTLSSCKQCHRRNTLRVMDGHVCVKYPLRGKVLTGGGATCVPGSNTNNLVNSGAIAGNINGTPSWVGGATPTTYCGYRLAGGSPGVTGASDGGQVGIGGGGNSACTTYGPPTGEGY